MVYVLKGSDEKPGLAALAMDELLQMAGETGKSVSISLYEVYQDHVYDLSDPKRPQVLVFEDTLGKIKLKGLSQACSILCSSYIWKKKLKQGVPSDFFTFFLFHLF